MVDEEKLFSRAMARYLSQFASNPHSRMYLSISISWSFILMLHHLIVLAQVHLIAKTALEVGFPLSELLIRFHMGQFIISLFEMLQVEIHQY